LAFLGDFGKFFGLGSSEQVLGDVGSAIGGFVGGPGGAVAGRSLGKTVGSATSSLASDDTANQPLQQSTIPTRTLQDAGPQEDIFSGGNVLSEKQAFIAPSLSLARSAGSAISKFFGSPTGVATSIGTGVAGLVTSRMGDMREKPILTQSRRNKARVRRMVMLLGLEGTAEFLSQASGKNVTVGDVVSLLLRTFRNDGAYITKAQVRNLRKTTNKFKTLEKQVKEATSMTRTTRRTTTRKMSGTTLISNK
jgi:hypothetical protein